MTPSCTPQDDKSVNAEQCINKASLLLTEETDAALMLQHKVILIKLLCVFIYIFTYRMCIYILYM